jgi:hypothetical protein
MLYDIFVSSLESIWAIRAPPHWYVRYHIFRQHAAPLKRAFQGISPDEQRQMEEVLKKIGRRAEQLDERAGHR